MCVQSTKLPAVTTSSRCPLFKLTETCSKCAFQLLLIDDHHDALRARYCSLPWRTDVPLRRRSPVLQFVPLSMLPNAIESIRAGVDFNNATTDSGMNQPQLPSPAGQI